jgi:hypothetical protein
MDIDKVKSNIRAMLNLANDSAASEGEINNAMRFVKKLMEEHQLSDADLTEVDDVLLNLERAEMASQKIYFNGAKLSEWESSAAGFACALVGGVKYYVTGRVPYRVNGILQHFPDGVAMKRPQVAFYGIAEDVEIARQIFAELTLTIASMAKLKWGGVFRKDGREYCEGFVSGLWSKYHEDNNSQKKLAQQSTGTALVAIENRGLVVNKKQELATKYLEEGLGIKLKGSISFSGNKQYSSEARQEGRSDGSKHNASVERRRKLGGPK